MLQRESLIESRASHQDQLQRTTGEGDAKARQREGHRSRARREETERDQSHRYRKADQEKPRSEGVEYSKRARRRAVDSERGEIGTPGPGSQGGQYHSSNGRRFGQRQGRPHQRGRSQK